MFDAGTAKIRIEAEDNASQKLAKVKEELKATENFTEKYSASIGKIGKIADRTAKITGAAIVAVAKMAIDSYSSYEQLTGGVNKLFKDSSDIVIKNADKAYKTAGISANKYMEQATSFSASLIQGLNGDTQKAAQIADVAIKDMSDNVNVFGSTQQSVQDAYRGFAKQNFTMLDNLKLGYGGTKTEMERLQKDAEKLTGKKYDVSNFADIVEAIHAIQQEYDITGTTAREAADTIEGSVNTMKAAWENWLTALGSGSAESIQKTTDALVKSIKNVGKNIIPVIGNVLKGMKPLVALFGAAVFTKFATKILLAENALRKFQAANAGLSVAQGVLQGKITAAEGLFGSLGSKINATSLVMKALPWAGAAAGATLLAFAIKDAYDSTHKYRQEVEELSKSNEKNIQAIEDNGKTAEMITGKIEELSQVENKSNSQKKLMAAYVKELNGLYPDLNLKYDEEKDKLSKTTDEIYKYIDAKREEAKAAAYQKNYEASIEKQVELERKRADAEKEYQQAKAQYDKEAQTGYIQDSTIKKLQQAKSELKDTSVAYQNAFMEATQWGNELSKSTGVWSDLTKEAKKAGVEIPQSIKDGIDSGKYVIPESMDELTALIAFDNASQQASLTEGGRKTVEWLAQGIRDGKWSAEEAVEYINKNMPDIEVDADTKPAEKNIQKLDKKKPKDKTTKVQADAQQAYKEYKKVNDTKIPKKTAKVDGDNKDAIKKIDTVNKKEVRDKQTKIRAHDYASDTIDSINHKRISNKSFSISAHLTGLSAKVKSFLGLRRGIREIPYDGFAAELHKGERVLTAPEVNQYESIMRSIGEKALKARQSEQAQAITNNTGTSYTIYIDGTRINDDAQIESKFGDLMFDMARRGLM